jgi:hypothetical protein
MDWALFSALATKVSESQTLLLGGRNGHYYSAKIASNIINKNIKLERHLLCLAEQEDLKPGDVYSLKE